MTIASYYLVIMLMGINHVGVAIDHIPMSSQKSCVEASALIALKQEAMYESKRLIITCVKT